MVNAFFLSLGLFLTPPRPFLPTVKKSSLMKMNDSSIAVDSLPPLVDSSGETLSKEFLEKELRNKRVAYYFGAGWCPMCTSFEPSLIQFRHAAIDSGKPMEMIYVSSDRDSTSQMKRSKRNLDNMWVVPFDQTAELKRKYKIWAGSESFTYGFGRRSGVPALVVLDKAGNELSFVAAEAQGVKALQSWPLEDESGLWV